jgi:hypothetical protein
MHEFVTVSNWVSNLKGDQTTVPYWNASGSTRSQPNGFAQLKRSPDPPKHIRDRLRRPLSAPRRPNAATVQRCGDLPKRLRSGGLGAPNGSLDTIGEGVRAGLAMGVGNSAGLSEFGIAERLSASLGGGEGGEKV